MLRPSLDPYHPAFALPTIFDWYLFSPPVHPFTACLAVSTSAYTLQIAGGNDQSSPVGAAGLPLPKTFDLECYDDTGNYPDNCTLSCSWSDSQVVDDGAYLTDDNTGDGTYFYGMNNNAYFYIQYFTGTNTAAPHVINCTTVPYMDEEIDFAVFTVTTTDDCPAGYYLSGGDCTYCEEGTISTTADATSCQDCGAGSAANLIASTECTTCPEDTYAPAASKSCLRCGPGKDTDGQTGAAACTEASEPLSPFVFYLGSAFLVVAAIAGAVIFFQLKNNPAKPQKIPSEEKDAGKAPEAPAAPETPKGDASA